MRLSRFAALLILSTAILPTVASAQISDADKATARELTVQGYDALKSKDYIAAADRFSRADKLFHAPTIIVGLAKANLALGKLVAAQELFSRAAHETVPPNASVAITNAVEEAQRELSAVAPRVPGVVINVVGPEGARVTIDDNVVPAAAYGVKRPVDPGKHVIRGIAPGHTPTEVTVTLAEGATETVSLEIKPGPGGPPLPPPPTAPTATAPNAVPAPAPPPPDQGAKLRRTVGFVGIGVGGAGLLAGAVAGGLAMAKHSDIATQCPNSHCPMGSQSMKTIGPEIDTYDTMGTVATAGFIAGGVLAAAGVVLVVTAPKAPQQVGRENAASKPTLLAAISPVVGAGYAGLRGWF